MSVEGEDSFYQRKTCARFQYISLVIKLIPLERCQAFFAKKCVFSSEVEESP